MEYKIYVGVDIKIKKGFLKGSFRFMYCGMAPSAKILAYNTQGNIPEIAGWASNGGMISNHSY